VLSSDACIRMAASLATSQAAGAVPVHMVLTSCCSMHASRLLRAVPVPDPCCCCCCPLVLQGQCGCVCVVD
jgi:hypothetical protein